MEEREENGHERLKQKLRELEQEWTAMKTGKKSSSAISWITVEEALEFVENSPTKLMLSLQHDEACPEAEMPQLRSPLRRKLFHDSDDDDEIKTATFSHSSCWSSNVMRASVNKKKKKKKKIAKIVYVSTVLLFSCALVILLNGFDNLSMNRQINTLVAT